MKHRKSLCLFFFTLGLLLLFAACGVSGKAPGEFSGSDVSRPDDSSSAENPDAPQNVRLDDWTLTWDPVNGADRYSVVVDEKTYNCSVPSLDVSCVFSPGVRYSLTVSAESEGILLGTTHFSCTAMPPSQGLAFRPASGGYEIARTILTEPGEWLVLPDFYNGKPVVSIATAAFGNVPEVSNDFILDYPSVTAIRLPASLRTIGYGAFTACKNLKTVVFPDTLQTIGMFAFSECNLLTKLSFPDTLESIGISAFNSPQIEEISLSENTELKDRMFDNTLWYQNQPDGFVCFGSMLYAYKGEIPQNTTLLVPDGIRKISSYAFSQSLLTDILFPDSVTDIQSHAFENCAALQNVVLSDSVVTIGESAFANCSSLQNISLSSKLFSVAQNAFINCTSLRSVRFSESLNFIGEYAFSNCTSLESAVFSGPTETISDHAFENCSSLKELVFQKRVLSIGDYAFQNCGIVSLSLPAGLQFIGNDAFSGCNSLSEVSLPATLTDADSAFWRCENLKKVIFAEGTTQIFYSMFSHCTSLSEIVFPDSLTTIEVNAFTRCAVPYLSLPDSITSIGRRAFYACDSLEWVELPASLRSSGIYVFGDCTRLRTVVLPVSFGVLDDTFFSNCTSLSEICYKGNETLWKSVEHNLSLPDSVRICFYWPSDPASGFDEYPENLWHYASDGITPVLWKKQDLPEA